MKAVVRDAVADTTGESDDLLDVAPVLERLVPAAVAGDTEARDLLLAEIQPLVQRYCRGRLGRSEGVIGSADDIAQDICLAVLNALPNYEIKGLSFRAFVYGIAAHKVTDAFRAIGRNRTYPVAELPDSPTFHDGPEQRLLAAEMAERLGHRLHRLTPRQREVIVLRIAVGLSAEETAKIVGSTPDAVRVTQRRALDRMRGIDDDPLDVDPEDPDDVIPGRPRNFVKFENATWADSNESKPPPASIVPRRQYSRSAYVDMIGSRLDLAAGLAQVRDRNAHASYVTELGRRLDLDSGLAAVHRAAAKRAHRSRPTGGSARDQQKPEAG